MDIKFMVYVYTTPNCDAAAIQVVVSAATAIAQPRGRGMPDLLDEVFYVDDSPDDRLFAEHCLQQGTYAFRLRMFSTGFAAILDMERRVARGELLPRLLVADYYMPVMDGPELLSLVRANSALSGVRLAICSGGDDPGDIETARSAGAQFILAKPLDLDACGDIVSAAREA
jgi:CheY-like chemotaxis protein